MPAHLLIAHAQEALVLSVVLSLPVILTAALVSYVVGAFQAASQIQDATIAHLPPVRGWVTSSSRLLRAFSCSPRIERAPRFRPKKMIGKPTISHEQG
jgi:hypothetical protein